jgi:DNA repair exonuclease SbcCD nuclease subunit
LKELVTITEPVKLLCTGDLHLGRHPTGIPEPLDGREYSPGSIWRDVVEKAIDEEVDLVVVAGDIVDRKNRYFEAFGDFEAGVKKLTEEEIPLYVVAGNHDFDAVPDLLEGLSDYEITQLGRNGEWEFAALPVDGNPSIHIAGWSYPDRHVDYNPLDQLQVRFTDGPPALGVLHGDLGSADSRYAPITETDLDKTGIDAWVIGHLHNPNLRSEISPFIVTPGSPQPLDPSERGLHGPWVLMVDPDGSVEAEQYPLGNLRYETVTLDAGDLERLEDIPPAFYSRTEELVDESRQVPVELLAIDLELKGHSPLYEELKKEFGGLAEDLRRESGETNVAVTSVLDNTRPEIDIEKLSRGKDLPALLADLILKLEDGREEDIPDELLDRTRESLSDAYYSNAYRVLRHRGEVDPPDRDVALDYLKEQAWLILESLLSQTSHER